ncbi:unnamed protein product [Closterium sp. Naga37s-1]|nr:unnamed protein product [Closterium sp. Naga37s-1]
MASQHNPDEFMAEGDLDPSFSVEYFFVEETTTPVVSAPPPAKRVCAAASSSSAPVAPPTVLASSSIAPTVTHAAAPVAGPSSTAPSTSTSWPTRDDAARFRRLLPGTIYRAADGPSAEIKVFEDPVPDFTAAKARGKAVLVIRNVPIGYATHDIKNLLMNRRTKRGDKWLGDLLHFHKLYDPYEESFLPQILGVPIAPVNDPLFEAAKVIGQHPAVAAFKADLGLLFIGTDIEVEVWTCALCSFSCGWALDSAMEHLASPSHAVAISNGSVTPSPIEEFGDMKIMDFNRNNAIASFLA